ncbi:unnamed protein product [Candida verbasci]|uniref:PHD-type domain-containing protein n=1 Tax=Candida verbasci TaxID=1227364 RepID=A0A9W4U1T1_9ASCO|nr:unnamed protein product [Candida verbasci]
MSSSTIETRRSSRSNKGQHSRREFDTFLNDLSDEEPKSKKKKTDKDVEEFNNFESEDEDFTGDEIVRCTPCGANQDNYDEENDELGEMIECEKCKTWQHLQCMGLKKAPKSDYLCNLCLGDNSKIEPPIATRSSRKISTSSTTIVPKKTKSRSKYDLSNPIEALKDDLRISTAKAFYNFFKKSYPEDDKEATEETKDSKALELTLKIEEIIHSEYPGQKNYTAESRRVLFLLKKHFTKDLFAGTITLEDVVKKTPQEINEDIAKIELQNKENIKNIVLIENDQSQIIRRTHKGEIIKENENEQQDLTIDDSISTRKVDHRRFSSEIDSKSNIISEDQKVLNNFNPTVPEIEEESQSELKTQPKSKPKPKTKETKKEEIEQEPGDDKYNPDYISDDDDEQEVNNNDSVSDLLWSGNITYEPISSCDLNGKFYSTTNSSKEASIKTIKEILYHSKYKVIGRLQTKIADDYLNKVLITRDLLFVKLEPTTPDQSESFSKLLDYFYNHERVGVLHDKPGFVKDAYIMAVDFSKQDLPYYLNKYKQEPIKGLFAVYVAKKDYNNPQNQPQQNNALQNILSQLS